MAASHKNTTCYAAPSVLETARGRAPKGSQKARDTVPREYSRSNGPPREVVRSEVRWGQKTAGVKTAYAVLSWHQTASHNSPFLNSPWRMAIDPEWMRKNDTVKKIRTGGTLMTLVDPIILGFLFHLQFRRHHHPRDSVYLLYLEEKPSRTSNGLKLRATFLCWKLNIALTLPAERLFLYLTFPKSPPHTAS